MQPFVLLRSKKHLLASITDAADSVPGTAPKHLRWETLSFLVRWSDSDQTFPHKSQREPVVHLSTFCGLWNENDQKNLPKAANTANSGLYRIWTIENEIWQNKKLHCQPSTIHLNTFTTSHPLCYFLVLSIWAYFVDFGLKTTKKSLKKVGKSGLYSITIKITYNYIYSVYYTHLQLPTLCALFLKDFPGCIFNLDSLKFSKSRCFRVSGSKSWK